MSAIKQHVVVLSAQQYEVTDKETGEIKDGTSVRYCLTDSLVPFDEDGLKGYKVAKASVAFNNYFDFTEVPGVYEADIDFRIDKDGKVNATAANFKFKKSLFPAPAGK